MLGVCCEVVLLLNLLQVGSAGSGKSSVVKTLAKLTEQQLKIFPVTSAMDTTDILGGFEQVSGINTKRHVISSLFWEYSSSKISK